MNHFQTRSNRKILSSSRQTVRLSRKKNILNLSLLTLPSSSKKRKRSFRNFEATKENAKIKQILRKCLRGDAVGDYRGDDKNNRNGFSSSTCYGPGPIIYRPSLGKRDSAKTLLQFRNETRLGSLSPQILVVARELAPPPPIPFPPLSTFLSPFPSPERHLRSKKQQAFGNRTLKGKKKKGRIFNIR